MSPSPKAIFISCSVCTRAASHGYGIMQETERLSGGRVKIGSGTMYGATGNMMKKGWIRETISDHPEDKRKRLYELTDFGREILIREVQRIRHLSDTADSIMKGDNG